MLNTNLGTSVYINFHRHSSGSYDERRDSGGPTMSNVAMANICMGLGLARLITKGCPSFDTSEPTCLDCMRMSHLFEGYHMRSPKKTISI